MQILESDVRDYYQVEKVLQIQDGNAEFFVTAALKKYEALQPFTVEIETINRCNNDCSFCPANRNQDKRTPMIMKEDLFYKIINELAEINYTGFISLFSNNEPLLDNRIFDFLYYARQKLPYAIHALFTNGILLNEAKYIQLVKSLNFLHIDNYDDNLQLLTNIKKIHDKKIDENNCTVYVHMRKKTQILSTRGGLSPNKDYFYRSMSPCVLPFTQMVIRPDGKISRCCQDVYGNETLGDASNSSLMEIWNSKPYAALRKQMVEGNRKENRYCAACDIFGFNNYTPKEFLTWGMGGLLQRLHAERRKILLSPKISNVNTLECLLRNAKIMCDILLTPYDSFNVASNFLIFGTYEEACAYEEATPGVDYLVADCDVWTGYVEPDKQKRLVARCHQYEKKNWLILWGAGRNAFLIQKKYAFHFRAVLDINEQKSRYFSEFGAIVRPQDVVIDHEKGLVLVSPSRNEEILAYLRKRNIKYVLASEIL